MFILWTLGIILRIVDVGGNAVAWICFGLFAIFILDSILPLGRETPDTVGGLLIICGFIWMVLGPMWLSLYTIGFAVCATLLAASFALSFRDVE